MSTAHAKVQFRAVELTGPIAGRFPKERYNDGGVVLLRYIADNIRRRCFSKYHFAQRILLATKHSMGNESAGQEIIALVAKAQRA